MGADIFVGITIYRSHKKVVSAGPWKHPKPPHNVLAPVNSHAGQLVPGQLSLAPVSTRPLCQLVPESTRPRVNSFSGQLVPGSTRTRVNSSPSQLVPVSTRPGTTRPRVNSSPCHTSSPSQLVPESIRPRVNSSSSQLVPGSTRDCTCPWSTCTHVNLHHTNVNSRPSHPATETTRTQVNSHPGTCLLHYPPTYLPTLPPTYLNTYLPPFIPPSLQTCIPTSPTLHTPPCLLLCLPTPFLHYLTSHSLSPYLHTVPP